MDISSFYAVLVLSVLAQAFIAAAWVVIGGLGGQWRVNQALARQADELEHLTKKVTRDQKVRAGEKRQESVREEKTLAVQAAELLAQAGPPTAAPARPSTLSAINGGKG